MQTIKERAFGFRALVQKIWDHIKYRKGYGTPDFQEGFLGISNWGWMNFQSKMHNLVDTFKWKYRAIKERTKTLSACSKFWKIPKVIETFQDAMYQAERELREQGEKNSKLHDEVVRAVEQIIDIRYYNGRYTSIIQGNLFNKKRGIKFLDESHKDYEDDLEDIRFLYEEDFGLRIPDQFLTEEEAEDRMWDGYDNRYDGYPGEDDFDFFRFGIDKSFYDSNKVCNEEFAKIEEEKQQRKDAEARLKEWE